MQKKRERPRILSSEGRSLPPQFPPRLVVCAGHTICLSLGARWEWVALESESCKCSSFLYAEWQSICILSCVGYLQCLVTWLLSSCSTISVKEWWQKSILYNFSVYALHVPRQYLVELIDEIFMGRATHFKWSPTVNQWVSFTMQYYSPHLHKTISCHRYK